MKICWMNEHLLYFNGGIRYIYEVARRLNNNNNEVDIMVTDTSMNNWVKFAEQGVAVCSWDTASAKNLKYWLFYPYYLLKSSQKIKDVKTDYDIFISSSPTSDIWCLLAGVNPIIVCFEVNPWLHNKEHIRGLSLFKQILVRVAKPFIRPIEKRAYRNAKTVICHSKFVQSEIKRVYSVDSIVVPVGVDSTFFSRRSRISENKVESENKYLDAKDAGKALISKPSKESLWDIYSKYSILLHVASYLSPMKGTKYAIEAMKWIIPKVSDALLLIIVARLDGKLQSELMETVPRGISSHIKFIPDVPDSDMPTYYSLAKVILQPSLDENAHYPTIEGGCCECPAIGFRSKFENEDIVNGYTGWIVPRCDSKEMAQSAIDIIRDKAMRDYLGRNARQFMLNKFSWNRCITKYKELISHGNN